MTITVVSVAIGIGVEDAIQYIYRFQEEIERDHDYVRTMYTCHLTIGNAMFYTSVAVMAGFGILAFSNFVPTALFGMLTGVAMVVACISSQTLLPALLLLFKPFGPDRSAESRHRLVVESAGSHKDTLGRAMAAAAQRQKSPLPTIPL
jgi:predicted RND superfamily exporter protein